ncbi:MAG: exo-alpha-sialidase [Euryarchaeota archaeon]|nr:exo-alpha-sialidase [Euryarchaeota archaeon]
MKPRLAVLAAILLASGCLAEKESTPTPTTSGSAGPAIAPTFAAPVLVETTGGGGAEPAVAVHPDGTQFVLVWTRLYRSADGGKTFTKLATPFKSNGDADLAITADGVLHFVGMTLAGQVGEPRLPYFRSTDKGESWGPAKDLSVGSNNVDRQFLSYDDGLLVLTWNDLTADENLVRVSTDAGKTWSEPAKLLAPRSRTVGAPAIHEKTIVQPLNLHKEIKLARSLDGGRTWTILPGPAFSGDALYMPQMAFDDGGTAYLVAAISTNNVPKIHVWSSRDDGSTWSAPVALTGARSNGAFPWIVAGLEGRVAVSFYERDIGNGAANAPWYPYVAVTNAGHLGSGWRGVRVVADPIRTRDICSGDSCPPEQWNFKDLFEMGLTKEGRPFLAWMKETVAAGTPLPVVGGGGGSTLTVHASTATSGWSASG